MTPQDGPVVIAGAGPVGLALAVELHRRGLAFRIVDREEGPTALGESRALADDARRSESLRHLGPPAG